MENLAHVVFLLFLQLQRQLQQLQQQLIIIFLLLFIILFILLILLLLFSSSSSSCCNRQRSSSSCCKGLQLVILVFLLLFLLLFLLIFLLFLFFFLFLVLLVPACAGWAPACAESACQEVCSCSFGAQPTGKRGCSYQDCGWWVETSYKED
jgi:hypothetical protein